MKIVSSNVPLLPPNKDEPAEDFYRLLLNEGLELLADFRRIKNERRRREIMRLVKVAADDD